MGKKELFEQVPTTRIGDKVLRRRRRPDGILRNISRSILKLLKGTPSR